MVDSNGYLSSNKIWDMQIYSESETEHRNLLP